MTCRATFVGLMSLLLGSDGPDTADSCQPINGGGYGPARTAGTQPKPDGAALLRQREQVAFRAMKARNMRQSKQASIFEAECRALVNEILRGGL